MGYKNVGSAVTHAQAREGSRSGKHGKREPNTAQLGACVCLLPLQRR